MTERFSIIDEINASVSSQLSSERHGAAVLNAEHPVNKANHLLVELDGGYASIEPVSSDKYDVADDLVGHTVLVQGKIEHVIDGKPCEFNGWFIGEEYLGAHHPYLLLSPGRVYERGIKPAWMLRQR
jgi:hypothetical protein